MNADPLSRYVDDAESLRRDLQFLLQDADDRQAGWTIRYAVDFAELYAYVLPKERERFRIFHDDDDQLAGMVQDNALRRILFGEQSAVLVAPYFLEFDSFIDRVPSLDLSEAAASAPELVAAARKIGARGDFQEVIRVVENIATSAAEMDLETLVDFATRYPDLLAQLKSFDSGSSAERLARLLLSGRFEELDAIAGVSIDPRSDIYDRWKVALPKKRQVEYPTNRLDALAVALLQAANDNAKTRQLKLRLITRSRAMHNLMREEVQAGLWIDEPLLRHPRCFAVFRNFESETSQFLRQLLGSVEAFLASAREQETIRGHGRRLNDTDELVLRKLQHLKEEWRTALELQSLLLPNQPARFRAHRVRELLQLVDALSKVAGVRKLLQHRIGELSGHVSKGHQFLGFLMQGQVAATRRIFEQEIVPHLESSSIILSSTREMPYKLQFHSQELRQWPTLGQKRHDWSAMLSFFERALASEAGDYEILLTFAYFFCIIANWDVAERYCRLALDERDAVFPHEGYFLFAYVLRRQKPDADRYRDALALIDAAMDAKSKRYDVADLEDPRYLKEKAVLLQVWWREHHESKGAFAAPPRGEEEAIGLCERALSHPDADLALKAQIFNNLAMQMLLQGDEQSRQLASTYLDRLESLKTPDDHSRWSVLIDDTLIWGRWKIQGSHNFPDLEDRIADLIRVRRSHGITKDERVQIGRHITEMRNSLSTLFT